MHCPSCNALNSEESQYCGKCGTPLAKIDDTFTYTPPTQPPREDTLYFSPGEIFGPRYKIIEEIGRGGMGRVYKAEDQELGITVALKMIHPEYSSRSHIVERFKKETLLARSISHENVVRIHDIGEVNRIKFISMDYVKGQSLKELILTSGTLTADTAISIMKQICEAINIANQKGIVHRDLKPQNILIDNNGKAYVTDFGVAKSVEVMEDSAPGLIIGTIQYISPEQAKGEKADTRSDIYSLGIIMYEMLTGEKPFKAETYTGYIQKHIHEKPKSPSKFNPNIPSYLEKIILKCLEKDKRDRYQNAEEILHDLEEQKVAIKPHLHRINVKKLLKVVYASIFALLIILVAYLIIGRKPPRTPAPTDDTRKSIAVMHFENLTGDENLDHLRTTLSEWLITDLSQSKHIYVMPRAQLLLILKELSLIDVKSYNLEDMRKIAQEGRVNHVLKASFSFQTTDIFRIDYSLFDINIREPIAQDFVSGEGEENLIPTVDKLTKKIKTNLELTQEEIAADFDKDIGKIFTTSQEALKFYIDGEKYYQEGDHERAIEVLKEAVNIDPGFVLAYRNISENYHYLDDIDQAKKYAQVALSKIDQDRDSFLERHLIQAWAYTILEDSYKKAIDTYEQLLEIYPDDEDVNTYLGALYRNMEEWDRAIELFEKVLKVNPLMAVDNLMVIYKAMGKYEKAREVLRDNRDLYPNSTFRYTMSSIYLCERKTDFALREAEIALSLVKDDDVTITELTGHIYHVKNNFVKAKQAFQQYLEKKEVQSQSWGRFLLSQLYLAQGKYNESRKEISKGIEDSRRYDMKPNQCDFMILLAYVDLQRKQYNEAMNLLIQAEEIAAEINISESKLQAIHSRGLTYLKMKKMNEAKSTAEELKQWIEKTEIQKYIRYYYHLKGMIAQEEGSFSNAIKEFENALQLFPHQQNALDEHSFYLNSLASVYYQTGDLEKAREQYEKIISLTTGRLQWGDIYAKSFYRLGKICQKIGWEGKAIEYFEKFLQLWEEADPDLPETADARKQLDVLKNTSKE